MPVPGPDKALCGAKTKTGTCKFVAGHMTDHLGVGRCYRHGGTTPNHRKAAIEQMVTRELRAEGVEPSVDPLGEYLSLVAEVTQFKDVLRARSAQLEDPEWITRSKLGVEDVAAILRAYERALDRCEKTLSNAMRLGLEARRDALAERDATAVAQAQIAALIAMGLADRLDQFRLEFHRSYGTKELSS